MAILWITTIGFVFCLATVGGILFFSIRSALNTEDATRIDKNDSPNSTSNE